MCDISSPAVTSNKTRHLSIRLPDDLYDRLEALAAETDESVSQCARRMLDQGSASPNRPGAVIDQAIAALALLRDRVSAMDGAAPPGEVVADESAPAESARAESARAESAPAESAPAESAPAESAPAESARAEFARAESAPAEPGHRSVAPSRAAREVNVHNAKSNLSRLLGDVARGEEIVIVHAGAPRAHLVAVDDPT